MARTGQVIVNPVMGARIEFRTTAEDSDGSLLEFDFFLAPDGVVATDHLHPHQQERFEVIAGVMRGRVDGREQTLGPGGASVVEPGVEHGWRNAGREEAHLRVRFEPALRTEDLFETVFALGAAGRTDERGVPRFPLRLAMLAAFPDEVIPAGMPRLVHRIVVRVLGRAGRRLRARTAAPGHGQSGSTWPAQRLLRRRART
jgi:quercetin dioxygenase-like cupin family protein